MKGYKIYRYDRMGYDYDEKYSINYSKAIQEFNNLLRKAMKDVYDTIGKEDFSEEVSSFRKWKIDKKLICRKCPFILYKQNKKLIARVYSWGEPSYEYREQDIESEDVVLEEIELIE